MVNMQEFARRLSSVGAAAFTSDDVVDLATAADIRISADREINASMAQRLLDQISPTPPVTGSADHGIAVAATCVVPARGAFSVVLQPRCCRRPG